jgi:tetratricopeptide (TPR) repeat protein
MNMVSEDLRRTARTAFERSDHHRLKKVCRAILEADPQDADARRLLGLAALKDDRPDLAEAWLRETTARRPDSASAWRNLARALVELRREQEAEAILSAAAARGVSTSGTMTMLGAIRARLDRAEDARAAYEAAIEMDPARGEAYWGLAELGGLAVDSAAYAQASRLIDIGRVSAAAAVATRFALAEADRRAGRVASFIARLHEANAAQRGLLPRHPPSAQDAWRRALTTAALEARIARKESETSAAPPPTPIFLVGEPCCGAELAEAMLASEPGVFAAGEINLFHGAVARELARMGRGRGAMSIARLGGSQRTLAREAYLERARRIAPDARWFVDRSRDLAVHAGALRVLFPEARIIRLERTPLRQGLDVYRRYRPNGDARGCDLTAIGRDLRAARRNAARQLRRSDLDIALIDADALATDPIETEGKLRAAAGLPARLSTFSSPRARRAATALRAVGDDTLAELDRDLAPLRRALGDLAKA